MRIKIIEALEEYNAANDSDLSMTDLALLVYRKKNTIDQTKINRLSALNTGRTTASIDDVIRIADVLNCSLTQLIDDETDECN